MPKFWGSTEQESFLPHGHGQHKRLAHVLIKFQLPIRLYHVTSGIINLKCGKDHVTIDVMQSYQWNPNPKLLPYPWSTSVCSFPLEHLQSGSRACKFQPIYFVYRPACKIQGPRFTPHSSRPEQNSACKLIRLVGPTCQTKSRRRRTPGHSHSSSCFALWPRRRTRPSP